MTGQGFLEQSFTGLLLPVTRRSGVAASTPAHGPSWSMANRMAGIAAMSEPTFGMKLSRNAIIPQSTGKSTPMTQSQMAMSVPVARLITVLMAR
jgi:hypothetical protein